MPIDPQAVSSATVRRALEGAGPSVVAQLRALAGPERVGEGLLPDAAAGLLERTEASKAWALQTSAREGARLLYEAARSCLAGVSGYAPLVDWVREPEALGTLLRRYGRLGNRAHGLGGRFTRFPSLEHGLGPRLASECLQIARAMDPGLLALRLQEGLVLMAQGEWEAASAALTSLVDHAEADGFVLHHASRNALMSLACAGRLGGRADLLARLASVTEDGSLIGFFQLELAAADRDPDAFDRAASRFLEQRMKAGPACRRSWMVSRLGEWAARVGRDPAGLQERLLEGWGS